MLCKRYGLKAEEYFFIDNLPTNADKAAVTGLSGMVFHDGDVEKIQEYCRKAMYKSNR